MCKQEHSRIAADGQTGCSVCYVPTHGQTRLASDKKAGINREREEEKGREREKFFFLFFFSPSSSGSQFE